MLVHTRGIVFHTLKYSDNSVIAKIYTEQFGLQSFIASGVHGKKSATKINLFQPLCLVECIMYKSEKKQLQRIKEIKCTQPYNSTNMVKNSLLFFINEVLYKSIKEEESNAALFNFIHHALVLLDAKTDHYINFHLAFLMQLAGLLGFQVTDDANPQAAFFDLQEGCFTATEPIHPFFVSAQNGRMLYRLSIADLADLSELNINQAERKFLLERIIDYYRLHLSVLRDIKSHKVLEEVLAA
jgi:DNA repair protein RecO (recombination protein O)